MAQDLWQDFIAGGKRFMDGFMNVLPPVTSEMNIPVRAVITDFDGVIGDNDRAMCEAYQSLKDHHFKDLPEWDEAKHYATHPRKFIQGQELSDKEKTALFSRGRQIYEHTPMHYLDGAEATMRMYQTTGMPWSVVSNNHCTVARWHDLGLDAAYPDIAVFDNAKKPSDRYLRAALEAMQQPAGRDVLMIDDNWKGLVAAADLGLTPVYIGDKSHIVLPLVAQECAKRNIAMPDIPIVRNNAELQQLVAEGIRQGSHQQRGAIIS